MTMMQTVSKAHDEVMAALVAGLEREFGTGAAHALAARFVAAEEGDFLWDARTEERWLGRFEGEREEGDGDLDRVAIIGRFNRKWFAAIVIVDGEGRFEGMIARRDFRRQREARAAYAALR